ncbi:MAG: sugar ABC transporter permease [Thermoanaerobaculia bacterium]|nr:sugar ABC transporter permease [Thermoanaerobaculia bacterium]
MSETKALRRRLAAGLLAGGLVGIALGWTWLGWSRQAEAGRAADQLARSELRALAELGQRAHEAGAGTAELVAQWQARSPGITLVRVVSLEERTLEASTAPADLEAGLLPRRLQREEKALFDAADAIRRAVESNREQEGPRKEVLALSRLAGGGRSVWGGLERDGTVTGAVQLETRPPAAAPPAGPLGPALAAALAPAVLFLLAAPLAGRRRGVAAALAALLLAGAFAFYAHHFGTTLAADRRAAETALAAALRTDAARGIEVLTATGLPAGQPLAAAACDVDPFGDRRGVIDDAGAPDEARLAAAAADLAANARRIVAGLGALALALALWIGLGAAGRAWRTLVRYRVAYAYVMPAMVGMLVLVFFPFFYGITLSFTNANIYNSDKPLGEIWIGLQNFKEILSDFALAQQTVEGTVFNYKNFYYTLGFTVIWTVSNVAIGVSLGLLLALILNTRGFALKPVYRVLLVLPWAVPNYITALVWKGMFHQQFGVVNQVLQVFGAEPVSWFERPLSSFVTVLATNGWLSFPFMMVIALGALQSIPADLYEAARVDGASRWQQFRSITLPSLKPALVPAVILSVIWTFNQFNIIYLVSQGEPAGSTEILITQAYKLAFEQYRYGYAAAYSTVIFFILLAYGTWQNRVTRATEGI